MVLTPLVEHFIDGAPDPAEMRAGRWSRSTRSPAFPPRTTWPGWSLFLASDEAAWITGHTVPIDGGYVAR